MRLLLVEDDVMIGEVVLDLLRAEHYAVDWVKDGDMADRTNATDATDAGNAIKDPDDWTTGDESMTDAQRDPHLAARGTFVERDGVVQPAPAPRFSRTEATLGRAPAPKPGAHTRAALTAWGITNVDDLLLQGVAVQVAEE